MILCVLFVLQSINLRMIIPVERADRRWCRMEVESHLGLYVFEGDTSIDYIIVTLHLEIFKVCVAWWIGLHKHDGRFIGWIDFK